MILEKVQFGGSSEEHQMGTGIGQRCPVRAGRKGPLILVGVAVILLSISSYIEIPMVPVPITAQTFMVLTVGAVLGPLLGTIGTVIRPTLSISLLAQRFCRRPITTLLFDDA